MYKFSKNTYTFGIVMQNKKKNWIIQKDSQSDYHHLRLSKKLKKNKTFTLTTKNKYGYRKLQTKDKTSGMKKAYISTKYYKIKGNKLRASDFANGKGYSEYTKVPTLASRRTFFGK
ncbi:hypothetical protein D8911_02500 [Levilactobacillus brevis]|nr:hypothetical protein D8911_02500 [Levilactobacillus brevis]